ncbi:GIDE domain-containing protein [Nitrosomonas sp.]|uniref:GIDE domain-containing protein n=1 Tax=Nitrosomonas sp. TaxID=42353 RepID=UPI001DD3AC8E|nr:GIDE domain-containing protein [Nitrosomonas sp.]MBX3616801.1 E3 ubiquitin--protein ligase [Nitrosomonas sp.]
MAPTELLPEEYHFALGVLLTAALLSMYYFARNWKRFRLIEDTPTAKLRSAHQGYIELVGKGLSINDQPIFAPLSNHPCLWYQSQIEEQETYIEKGRTQTRWNVVYKTISDQRFKLTDGVATCLVDPKDAEVTGHEKLIWYGNTEWPARTQVFESQSIIHAMANQYRYTESLILPGQPVYVLGQYRTWSEATQQTVRDVMIQLINSWKQNQQQLRERFDINKDGNIDQEEWEVARQQARLEAQQLHDQLALQPDENIIARPDRSDRPFIISVYSQTVLVRKYRRHAAIAGIVWIVIVGYAIWLAHTYG